MMKKIRKSMVFFLSVILLVNYFGIKASAIEKSTYAEEINIANEFIRDVLKKDSYDRIIELYDVNDVVNYLFFDLGQDGYVIVSIEYQHVVEGSGNQHKYITGEEERYYYNGPLAYYKKRGQEYVELHSGNLVKQNAIQKKIPNIQIENDVDALVCKTLGNDAARGNTDYTVTINEVLPNYTYVVENTCGSTAAAMLLRYYDYYVNDNYVPDELESRSGATLMRALIPYIEEPVVYGSDVNRMYMGLQDYIDDVGVNYTVRKSEYLRSTFKSAIDNDKPVLASLSLLSPYNQHWVTAYGYYRTTTSSVQYIVVNDGLGNSEIQINPSYVEDIVY